MQVGDFFRYTDLKGGILFLLCALILVSGIMSSNVRYCVTEPCPQETSTAIAGFFYNVSTFGHLFVNTQFAVSVKNFLNNSFGWSAEVIYLGFSLVISLIIYYFIISTILFVIEWVKEIVPKKQTA